jgi:hypothetical protein
MLWKDLEDSLKTSYPDHKFSSYINFNEDMAYLDIGLSFSDVDATKDRFTNEYGVISLNFRVASYVPGSDNFAAANDDTSLPYTDFIVVILVADACGEVSLINT